MPSYTDEIKQMMDEKVFDQPLRNRGLEIVGFAVESVTLDEESEQKIDNYELSSNSYMQQGKLVDAYANAVQDAASNANGAMNGFMGIGMMNMSTGGVVQGAVQGPWNQQNIQNSTKDLSQEQQPVQQTVQEEKVAEENKVDENVETKTWKCECGHENAEGAKFCNECGKPKKVANVCPKCGTENANGAKFCNNCGEKL